VGSPGTWEIRRLVAEVERQLRSERRAQRAVIVGSRSAA
jgi:hypothetical protein